MPLPGKDRWRTRVLMGWVKLKFRRKRKQDLPLFTLQLTSIESTTRRSGRLERTLVALSDHNSDDRPDYGPSGKIRKPVNCNRDACADVQRVGESQNSQPFLLWKQLVNRRRHCQCNCSMRGGPPPKDSAAQKTKVKNTANIGAWVVQRVRPAGNGFVSRGDQRAD